MTNLEVWQLVDMKGMDDAIFEGYLDPAEVDDPELRECVEQIFSVYPYWRKMQSILDKAESED